MKKLCTTYSILCTDRFGTLKSTSGGLVVLLDEAVDVPLARLVVAEEPGAVTEGEADAPILVVALAVSLAAAVVVAADCAETKGSKKHSAERRMLKISMMGKSLDRELEI